jgi:hypothetical protein
MHKIYIYEFYTQYIIILIKRFTHTE